MDGHCGNTTESLDYFDSLNSVQCRLVMLVCYLLVQIVGNPLLFVVIWYEQFGKDQTRTLLNQLMSHYVGYIMASNVLIFWVPALRVILGTPWPPFVCLFQAFLSHYAFQVGSLTLLQNIIIRLLYAFYWKTVGPLNDEFFGLYLFLLNNLLAFQSSLAFFLGDHHIQPDYFICSGTQPRHVRRVFPDYPMLLAFFNVTLHIGGFIALHIHKNRVNHLQKIGDPGEGRFNFSLKSGSRINIMGEEANLIMLSIILFSMLPFGIMITDIDLVVRYPVLYVLSLCLPYLMISLALSSLVFILSPDMRKMALRKIRESFIPWT